MTCLKFRSRFTEASDEKKVTPGRDSRDKGMYSETAVGINVTLRSAVRPARITWKLLLLGTLKYSTSAIQSRDWNDKARHVHTTVFSLFTCSFVVVHGQMKIRHVVVEDV